MKVQNTNINFQAGLTQKMQKEIASSDIKRIAQEFAKNGIQTDFKENKVIAWCSLKCLEIIKYLNENYHLNLGLPNGIFVEDFQNLNIQDKSSIGFLNFAPVKLHKKDSKITPEKTIFFNEFKDFNHSDGNEYWERIDCMADENFDRHFSSTDFFLEPILHEFLHAVHEQNLIQKLGGKKLVKLLEETLTPPKLEIFRAKYQNMLEKICVYASENPFEAVACDFSKRTIENIDKNVLLPCIDFVSQSPYKKQSLFKRFLIRKPDSKITETLHHFWNGKME